MTPARQAKKITYLAGANIGLCFDDSVTSKRDNFYEKHMIMKINDINEALYPYKSLLH